MVPQILPSRIHTLSHSQTQIFLRELISNASDALDKIRFLSLTDKAALSATEELAVRIKADRENHALHITDTGIGQFESYLSPHTPSFIIRPPSIFFLIINIGFLVSLLSRDDQG